MRVNVRLTILQIRRIVGRVTLPLVGVLLAAGVAYVLVLNVSRFRNGVEFLDSLRTVAAIAQSAASTVGILIAGVWGYYRFVRGRTFVRRLQTKLSARLVEESFIAIDVIVRNVGSVAVDLVHANLRTTRATGQASDGPSLTHMVDDIAIDVLSNFGSVRETLRLEPQEEVHRLIVTRAAPLPGVLRVDLVLEDDHGRCWSDVTLVV